MAEIERMEGMRREMMDERGRERRDCVCTINAALARKAMQSVISCTILTTSKCVKEEETPMEGEVVGAFGNNFPNLGLVVAPVLALALEVVLALALEVVFVLGLRPRVGVEVGVGPALALPTKIIETATGAGIAPIEEKGTEGGEEEEKAKGEAGEAIRRLITVTIEVLFHALFSIQQRVALRGMVVRTSTEKKKLN